MNMFKGFTYALTLQNGLIVTDRILQLRKVITMAAILSFVMMAMR